MRPLSFRTGLVLFAALALALLPGTPASAFCGFYVSGADGSLYANATMVVMMRDGQRTVLSMQNNYQGPPQDFAMVVPVPVVLSEDNVRTLPREVFTHVDHLAAPRLVEYWEEDPCAPVQEIYPMAAMAPTESYSDEMESESSGEHGVTVEAEFAVGEYDIVILSARDSGGLETWLHQEHYNIPSGAGEVLRPYVEAGTKFFVARVDVERVTFVDGRALLSPLRVHYDTPDFTLPVRLGLLNSQGQQDLIVHILARNQRYEVANYANAFIPTNIEVTDGTRHEFGAFYEWLFRQTVERNPRTVVTEYSWDSSGCDPCPEPPLEPGEILTLGADVVDGGDPYGFVLTRLHYRYTADDLGEDLVFRAAPPVTGGRGVPAPDGSMVQTPSSDSYNQFQGRYAILHRWEGQVSCQSPQRGRWGGPPGGAEPPALAAGNTALTSGIPSGSDRGAGMIAVDVPALELRAGAAPPPGARPSAAAGAGGCASCSVSRATGFALSFGVLGLLLVALALRRRR